VVAGAELDLRGRERRQVGGEHARKL
jgi:hypothetical protein